MAESIIRSLSLKSVRPAWDAAPEEKGTTKKQEAQLLARIRAGDAQAFATLVRQYGGRMHAVARRFLSHDDDRADAVQEAFLAAYRSIPSFEGRSALWTWLFRVQINTCLAIRRARSRPRVLSLDSLPRRAWDHGRSTLPGRRWSEPADARAERAEARAQIRDVIQRLPQPYRDVLFLRDIEGLDTDQTAKRLGTPSSTVKTRLHRARQALRNRLEPLLRMQA